MNRPSRSFRHQHGQVAIIVAICIALLIMMVGLVVDLGYLYTRKTELQNAADAAALAGAKELDGTTGGIDNAVLQARALLLANHVDFGGNPIDIEGENIAAIIQFSSRPSGATWYSAADAKTNEPANKLFIKVDTAGILQGSHPTWFMRVAGFDSTTTYGMAVAGHTVCEGLPMFTCVRPGGVAPNYGFVPGTSYRLTPSESSPPQIGPGNIGWMDPVPPGAPGLISGANDMREILCRGETYCLSAGEYQSLTQPAFSPMMDALNTRFGIYQGPLNDAEHKQACPSDTNVKEYLYNGPATAPREMVVNWLVNTPLDKQGLDGTEVVNFDVNGVPTPKVVHWAAVRPATGDDPEVNGTYPSTGTPYSQTTIGSFFQPPPATAGGDPVASQAGRRYITLGIADNCDTVSGSGSTVNVVAFARFLMQKQGVGTGADKGFHGEFIEMVSNTPPVLPEIKLYR